MMGYTKKKARAMENTRSFDQPGSYKRHVDTLTMQTGQDEEGAFRDAVDAHFLPSKVHRESVSTTADGVDPDEVSSGIGTAGDDQVPADTLLQLLDAAASLALDLRSHDVDSLLQETQHERRVPWRRGCG